VALFIGGLLALAHFAQEQLRDRDRYTAAFADIDCTPPPPLARTAFLDEVQYLARLSGRLHLLDGDLPRRLAAGFAKHPWVAKVEQVEVTPAGRVAVRLAYRRPVLAVRFAAEVRVVDGEGILLPRDAPSAGLPIHEAASPPAGPAGTRWGDAALEAAARRAAGLMPAVGSKRRG
jgi:hypothetical protein